MSISWVSSRFLSFSRVVPSSCLEFRINIEKVSHSGVSNLSNLVSWSVIGITLPRCISSFTNVSNLPSSYTIHSSFFIRKNSYSLIFRLTLVCLKSESPSKVRGRLSYIPLAVDQHMSLVDSSLVRAYWITTFTFWFFSNFILSCFVKFFSNLRLLSPFSPVVMGT